MRTYEIYQVSKRMYMEARGSLSLLSMVNKDKMIEMATLLFKVGAYEREIKDRNPICENMEDDNAVLEAVFSKYQGDGTYGLIPSISVGDIVRVDNTYYICASQGWDKIAL